MNSKVCQYISHYITTKNALVLVILMCLFFLFSLLYFVIQHFLNTPNLSYGFCFSAKCLKVVEDNFSSQIALAKEVITLTALIITMLSVKLGFSSYRLTLNNSILNNHIANFRLFCEFCDNEILKYQRIKKSRINFFKLYNNVYPESKKGLFDTHSNYQICLNNIAGVIADSSLYYENYSDKNKRAMGKVHYDYRRHQYNLIKALERLGVSLEINHRNDFYFIENELFNFIDSVTAAFTDEEVFLSDLDRKYL